MDIGADDVRLSYLGEAAGSIEKTILEKRELAVQATLAALDVHIAQDSAALEGARRAISEHWKLYKNMVGADDMTLCRCVLFQAVVNASKSNEQISAAVWQTARNITQHIDVGVERQIWQPILTELSEQYEILATKLWSALPHSNGSPTRDELRSKLRQAIGGVQIDGSEFDPPATQLGVNFQNRQQFAEWANIAADQLSDIVLEFGQSNPTLGASQLQWRADLSWWKQALYSPSAQRSYRDFNNVDRTILMAYDVAQLTPTYIPNAVHFVLREALRDSGTDVDEKITIAGVLSMLQQGSGLPQLEALRLGWPKVPLICIAADAMAAEQIEPLQLRNRATIDAAATLTYGDLSAWLLDDLVALSVAHG